MSSIAERAKCGRPLKTMVVVGQSSFVLCEGTMLPVSGATGVNGVMLTTWKCSACESEVGIRDKTLN